jgi:DNA-binding PadR family transcriptional regulator
MGGRSLGELERLVMLAILALGDDAYGASIRREIESRTGRDVAVGAIYTALDRLERRDAVRSSIGDPTAERGGRRRKHYVLLPAGATDLARSLQAIDDMTQGMDRLLASLPGAGER